MFNSAAKFKFNMGRVRTTSTSVVHNNININPGDMILELKTEEFACHKIVMTATSEYFKKALRENEMVNKYQY
jgi:hypothetical protein